MRVVVVGLGKVGYHLAFYLHSIGHSVIGLDVSPGVVRDMNLQVGAVDEQSFRSLPLSATTDAKGAYADADAAVLIVPTPAEGDKLSSEHVRQAGEEARVLMRNDAHLFIASTLDPRDAGELCGSLNAIYTPVFIRLGSVFEDLQNQKYLLVGSPDQALLDRMYSRTLAMDLWKWPEPSDEPVIVSDHTTIACAKLAINATLSSRIAWANDVAVRAKAFGADPSVVCQALQLDPRLGAGYLTPGWVPSGPCLPRDLDVWTAVQGQGMAEAVLVSHRATERRILASIVEQLNEWPVRSVLVIGLTYKEKGLDWTHSLGLEAVRECAKHGYHVYAYDREGTPAALIEKAGGSRISDGASLSNFDAIIAGFPGYPEECAEAARQNSRGLHVINPWR